MRMMFEWLIRRCPHTCSSCRRGRPPAPYTTRTPLSRPSGHINMSARVGLCEKPLYGAIRRHVASTSRTSRGGLCWQRHRDQCVPGTSVGALSTTSYNETRRPVSTHEPSRGARRARYIYITHTRVRHNGCAADEYLEAARGTLPSVMWIAPASNVRRITRRAEHHEMAYVTRLSTRPCSRDSNLDDWVGYHVDSPRIDAMGLLSRGSSPYAGYPSTRRCRSTPISNYRRSGGSGWIPAATMGSPRAPHPPRATAWRSF